MNKRHIFGDRVPTFIQTPCSICKEVTTVEVDGFGFYDCIEVGACTLTTFPFRDYEGCSSFRPLKIIETLRQRDSSVILDELEEFEEILNEKPGSQELAQNNRRSA